MGTWNGTCAISQLPILASEPALLVLLQQSLYADISESGGRDMLGGAGSLWTPRTIPIRGTYDGFGNLKPDDPDHWTVRLALARFQLDLVEREVGENGCQDLPVKLDDVLNGCAPPWSDTPMSAIKWVQALVHKDRLRVLVPKWLDSEEDREKVIQVCLKIGRAHV